MPFHGQPLAELALANWQLYGHEREDEGYETFPMVLRRVQQVVWKLVSVKHWRCFLPLLPCSPGFLSSTCIPMLTSKC